MSPSSVRLFTDQPRDLPSLQEMLCRAVMQHSYRRYMGEHLAQGGLSEMDHEKQISCVDQRPELYGADLFLRFPR